MVPGTLVCSESRKKSEPQHVSAKGGLAKRNPPFLHRRRKYAEPVIGRAFARPVGYCALRAATRLTRLGGLLKTGWRSARSSTTDWSLARQKSITPFRPHGKWSALLPQDRPALKLC